MNGMDNQSSLMNSLSERFKTYKKKRIAIYGLGENAKLLVSGLSDYSIIGLVAKENIGETKYGLPVLSLSQALIDAEIIIIAASFSATKIIYARICGEVPVNVKILDMYGEYLNSADEKKYDPYWEKNFESLCATIDEHDVISFDIFDTLIMRDLLTPKDIFDLIEEKSGISGFAETRKMAEKTCRQLKAEPTIEDIYEEFAKQTSLKRDSIQRIKSMEIETEHKHILARKTMKAALEYAIQHGKKVFLTSDMYYSVAEMKSFLDKCEIEGNYELIVSSEWGMSKFQGDLYQVLKNKACGKRILHIGDDTKTDVEQAKKAGICSFQIRSAYELLASSCYASLFDGVENKDDRFFLGYFLPHCLNDPFAMRGTMGKIPISDPKTIAGLLFPITHLFLHHIIRHARDYDCLLFPSRDGFFLCQLYSMYREMHSDENLPEAKYVYASRMALSRAALSNERNFKILTHKLFHDHSQNCKVYLESLFGIDVPDEFDKSSGELMNMWGKDVFEQKLMELFDMALSENKENARSYRAYLEKMDLSEYDRFAMVDIVSYGTQVFCLSEILGKRVEMIAIGSTSVPNAYLDEDKVHTIYGNINKEINGAMMSVSDMSMLHLFIEVLYSSSDGQFVRISENGVPVFLKGSEYNKSLLETVQGELLHIMDEFDKNQYISKGYSKEFSYAMLRVLRSQFSCFSEELKKQLVFSDPFRGGLKTVNLMEMV